MAFAAQRLLSAICRIGIARSTNVSKYALDRLQSRVHRVRDLAQTSPGLHLGLPLARMSLETSSVGSATRLSELIGCFDTRSFTPVANHQPDS